MWKSSSKDKYHCRIIPSTQGYSQFMAIKSGNGMWKVERKIISLYGDVSIVFVVYKSKAEN